MIFKIPEKNSNKTIQETQEGKGFKCEKKLFHKFNHTENEKTKEGAKRRDEETKEIKMIYTTNLFS